jgi:hypothetical protein
MTNWNETMDMSDPAVQAELEADKRAALARLESNPGTFLWNYGPGDTVVYRTFNELREVLVEERRANLKNGEPGFTGTMDPSGQAPAFRPNSRNTCPYPGCDEPRAEEWPMTCPAHSPEAGA